MYLLDTNICIDFALGRSEALRERMRQSYAKGLAISMITLAELRVGPRHPGAAPEDARRLDVLVGLLTVHAFDDAAATAYGEIARSVSVKRKSFDRLIAAHARALDLTLVTRNEAYFTDVARLRVENWTLPL